MVDWIRQFNIGRAECVAACRVIDIGVRHFRGCVNNQNAGLTRGAGDCIDPRRKRCDPLIRPARPVAIPHIDNHQRGLARRPGRKAFCGLPAMQAGGARRAPAGRQAQLSRRRRGVCCYHHLLPLNLLSLELGSSRRHPWSRARRQNASLAVGARAHSRRIRGASPGNRHRRRIGRCPPLREYQFGCHVYRH